MTPGKKTAPAADDSPISTTVTICNERGLHARAASKFVKLVSAFDADVTVTKGGQSVSGTSILGLMMLAASIGTEIVISTSGPQSQDATAALCELVEARFEE